MATSDQQFGEEVLPFELEAVRARRKALGLDRTTIAESLDQLAGPAAGNADGARGAAAHVIQPSTGIGLIGLALSGGGIRSATISLGAIQALAARQKLRQFDYLSTVSGGGYIGACLSSLLNDPQARPDGSTFPLAPGDTHRAGRPLRHLRNSGSYLTPGGLLDWLRIPAVILRGILLNLLIFLPYIMVVVLLTEVIYEAGSRYLGELPIYRIFAAFVLVFLGVVILSPVAWRLFRKRFTWSVRNRFELLASFLVGLCLLTLTLIPFTLAVGQAIDQTWSELTQKAIEELQSPFEQSDLWKWAALLAVALATLFAAKASTRLESLSGKLLVYALSLLGPAVILVLYLAGCIIQIDSPWLPAKHRQTLAAGRIGAQDRVLRRDLEAAGVALPAAEVDVRADGEDAWLIEGDGHVYRIVAPPSDRTRLRVVSYRLWDDEGDWIFLGVLAGLFLFNLIFLDVNVSSAHGFYRDRLSAAYLFRRTDSGDIEASDTVKLSQLNAPDTAAPYHLINVALNLQGSADPAMRDRRADFFILSPGFTGGHRTGYCRTSRLEEIDNHVDLGTAMAISGAAASPNMGVTTLRPLVFVLTLLNIRLGYWLPNPAQLNAWRRRFMPTPWLLLRESVSAVDDSGPYVNVSDGGHLENLGAYELLRRRCKLIVAIDGEADPELFFGSLVKLIRYARIDFGIEIEIDLEPLRPLAETGRSQRQWAVGTIDYGSGEQGQLLYLKSTLTTDLANEDIRGYLDQQPAFPNQPTSDQFFDEAQFEAYRSLGFEMASRALEDPTVDALFSQP